MEALTRHPRQQRFIAPLGVGARLQSGGVPAEKITELGRDEIIGINGVKYAAEPALHLSAHWTHDRNKTLQASCALADAFTGAAIPATANPSPPSVKKTAVSTSPLSKSTLRRCDAANSGWRNTHMFPDQAAVPRKSL